MTSEREWVYLMDGCIDARDVAFPCLPDGVIACLSCRGNGKRRQSYIEGNLTGACDLCNATGFVYRETARAVPSSVINQIAVAHDLSVRHSPMYGNDWRRP